MRTDESTTKDAILRGGPCRDCEFFVRETKGGDDGTCHRHPPVVAGWVATRNFEDCGRSLHEPPDISYAPALAPVWRWPCVCGDGDRSRIWADWCGDFVPRGGAE